MVNGEPEYPLSPEEIEAVRVALAGEPPPTRRACHERRALRLGYLGPAGTFTHAALAASWRSDGRRGGAVPDRARDDPGRASAARSTRALVPIENSIEGGVNATLDTLAFDAEGVSIVGEEVLPVTHALIARAGRGGRGRSPPSSRTPSRSASAAAGSPSTSGDFRPIAATSTAEAVRLVSAERRAPRRDRHDDRRRRSTAATSSPRASRTSTATRRASSGLAAATWRPTRRSAALAATRARRRLGAPKTSIVFHGAGDASPGWLVRCLSELAFRGINLTRIESRPLKRQLGHYLFFVDLEGDAAEPAVAEAIERLRVHAEVVRVLGSYPRATALAPAGAPAAVADLSPAGSNQAVSVRAECYGSARSAA